MSIDETAPAEAAPHPVYDRAVATFRAGAQSGATWSPMIVYVGLLALSFGTKETSSVSILVAVLAAMLFRDLGRWAGVHLLGYPDRDLLLFPFFRKVIPAEGDRTERWKQALIILFGPLPGIFVAFVLAITLTAAPAPALRHQILVVTMLNAMMLAPLRAFDGGRLLSIVVFSRSRWLELLFVLVTGAVLLYASYRLNSVVWAIVAALSILYARTRFRIAAASADLRARFPDLPARPEDVPGPGVEALFAEADRLASRATSERMQAGDVKQAPVYASLMRQIHDGAVLVPPSWLASILLLALYGAGIVLAAATAVILVMSAKGAPI